MSDDQRQFLWLYKQLPARLTTVQVAWILNCQSYDIPLVVRARLLRPLGNPPSHGCKYFSAAQIKVLANDDAWLAKVTNVLYQHWRLKNSKKKEAGPHQSQLPPANTMLNNSPKIRGYLA